MLSVVPPISPICGMVVDETDSLQLGVLVAIATLNLNMLLTVVEVAKIAST
jgi:hypothetical protein